MMASHREKASVSAGRRVLLRFGLALYILVSVLAPAHFHPGDSQDCLRSCAVCINAHSGNAVFVAAVQLADPGDLVSQLDLPDISAPALESAEFTFQLRAPPSA